MRDNVVRWAPVVLAVALAVVVVIGLASAAPAADRAERLASQLRCPVCQSESVADSTATTAREMRDQIDRFVAEGRSDAEILTYYEARYGRWIRLSPPLAADTVLLWAAPVIVLLIGAVVVGRRRRDPPVPTIAEADRERLETEIARFRQDEIARFRRDGGGR